MNRHRIYQTGLFLLIGFFSVSCATEQALITWEGEIVPQEKYPQEWTLSVNEQGQASLSLPYGENIRITGEAFPRNGGSWVFHMDYLEWFSNWHKGWTEARFSMLGSVMIHLEGEAWNLEVLESPEITGVLEGEIRYKESRFYGDRSRDMVSRRWTRVEAAVPFVQESLNLDSYRFAHKKQGYYSKEFLRDLESLLFPELYGYAEELPEPEPCGKGEERYTRGEGIPWDSCYSEAYLPEELRPVRDSGTLYRDYEETAGFFTLAVTWDSLWEETIPQSDITLRRDK